MIIKIVYPSSCSRKKLSSQAKALINNDKTYKKSICFDKTRNQLLISFDSADTQLISDLRDCVSLIFDNMTIGVDYANPITANHSNIFEYVWANQV